MKQDQANYDIPFFRLLDNSTPDLHDKSWHYFFLRSKKKEEFIQKLNYYSLLSYNRFFVKLKNILITY